MQRFKLPPEPCRPQALRHHGPGQTHLKKIYRLGAMEDPIEITLAIFRDLPDPRVERTKIHGLETIMFIALCSYLSGGDGFYDMEDYAHARQDWLSSHIGMQSIPSHDTFNRVFQAISPSCFGECLLELSRRLREKVTGDIVAFDGKTHALPGRMGQLYICSTLGPWKIVWFSDNWP